MPSSDIFGSVSLQHGFAFMSGTFFGLIVLIAVISFSMFEFKVSLFDGNPFRKEDLARGNSDIPSQALGKVNQMNIENGNNQEPPKQSIFFAKEEDKK